MNVLPKWAMMFSVCVPVIGQLIFLYIIYSSYSNLLFIRPETTRTFGKDVLLVALTGGLIVFFLIPSFFREVSLGAQRLQIQLPNYVTISLISIFAFFVLFSFFYIFLGWGLTMVWFFTPLFFTYLFISPFETIHTEIAEYL